MKPGITGWAQINGRDELEIPVKAKLDGDYTSALNAGKFKGFAMDVKCFFGTIVSVLRKEGLPDDTDDTDDGEAVTDDQPTEHTEGE
jgi:O-antigen biosynthesis protein WbqP